LQQLRLFGKNGELHLWRTASGRFRARVLDETEPAEEKKFFDESQILWGDRFEAQEAGYTLVAEGQGVRHAVPLTIPAAKFGSEKKRRRPLRLVLRHYLTHDEIGQARIYLSRLVNLSIV
jgi:CRISPR-associated protein (TIGR03984 family)